MVGRLEFESRTCGLKGRCSTVELATHIYHFPDVPYGLGVVGNPVNTEINQCSYCDVFENGCHFPSLKMVADAGLEPASPNGREILSLVCIPIPPISHVYNVSSYGPSVKCPALALFQIP